MSEFAQREQGPLQERSFPCAGARNQIDRQQPGRLKSQSKLARNLVILIENAFANLKNARLHIVILLVRQLNFDRFNLHFATLSDVATRRVATWAPESLNVC
jgi:hypothetical protein